MTPDLDSIQVSKSIQNTENKSHNRSVPHLAIDKRAILSDILSFLMCA